MKLKNSGTEQRRGRSRFPEVESDNRWAGRQPRKGRRRSRSRMGLWECGQSQLRTRNPKAAPTRIVRRLSKQSALPVNANATERRTKPKQDAGKHTVPIL